MHVLDQRQSCNLSRKFRPPAALQNDMSGVRGNSKNVTSPVGKMKTKRIRASWKERARGRYYVHPWRKVAPMAGVGNSDFSFKLFSLLIPPLGFTINHPYSYLESTSGQHVKALLIKGIGLCLKAA